MREGGEDHRTLVVFVKHPTPGAVKTRLVPALGAETAAALYRALVEHVLAGTSPARGEYERLVFYAPREATQAMRRWLVGVQLRHQAGEGLGERLTDAVARAFRRGAGRVAVIGSDAPSLTRADVTAAFAALDAADVVLGPAEDGGYYLVALRAPQPHPGTAPDRSADRARTAAVRVHAIPRPSRPLSHASSASCSASDAVPLRPGPPARRPRRGPGGGRAGRPIGRHGGVGFGRAPPRQDFSGQGPDQLP